MMMLLRRHSMIRNQGVRQNWLVGNMAGAGRAPAISKDIQDHCAVCTHDDRLISKSQIKQLTFVRPSLRAYSFYLSLQREYY